MPNTFAKLFLGKWSLVCLHPPRKTGREKEKNIFGQVPKIRICSPWAEQPTRLASNSEFQGWDGGDHHDHNDDDDETEAAGGFDRKKVKRAKERIGQPHPVPFWNQFISATTSFHTFDWRTSEILFSKPHKPTKNLVVCVAGSFGCHLSQNVTGGSCGLVHF